MFEIRSVDWSPPEPSGYDALMLTSGHAATRAGPSLSRYTHLPCYCVGTATAASARRAGLGRIVAGPGDGAALAGLMAADGIGSALHLCGRDHLAVVHSGLRIERRIVYAAEPVAALPAPAADALRGCAVALIHSPAAGRLFARLFDEAGLKRRAVRIAAISPAAAAGLGTGWAECLAASTPTDHALLELASKLCQNAGESRPGL